MSGAVGVGVGALGGLLGLELCLGLLGVSWGWVLWEEIRGWGSWSCVWGCWGSLGVGSFGNGLGSGALGVVSGGF